MIAWDTSPYVRYWDESKTKRETGRDKQTKTKKTAKMSACTPSRKTKSESMKDTVANKEKGRNVVQALPLKPTT